MNQALNWSFVDCVALERYEAVEFPVSIGTSKICTLNMGADESVTLLKCIPDANILFNGIPMADHQRLELDTEYTLKVDGRFYLLRGGSDIDGWIRKLNFERWILQDVSCGEFIGLVPFHELREFSEKMDLDGSVVITTVEGAEQGFYLKDVLAPPPLPQKESQTPTEPRPDAEAPSPAFPEDDEIVINTVSGEFNCPHCWRHFDRENIMWIARHPDLRDPDLGKDYPLRFFPTNFDERGRAIDGRGVRCSEMACPTCKSKLPPQYLDLNTHIFSVVGAPSSGKSYFLTSLINQLEEKMPFHFGLSFADGDASGNAVISDMRARLFSDSPRPENLYLGKTAEGGVMFKKWTIEGREVDLPKPFTYLVSPFAGEATDDNSLLLVLYDNAGEQFEPAERSEAAEYSHIDTTQYLASSDTIFFLYDPASNVRFRRMITDKDDPQVQEGKYMRYDRQDNIIAEMRNRIKTELFLDAREKIDTPLAMIIGKCDLWSSLLPRPLVDPLATGGLSLDAIEKNSASIREFLMKTSPSVVGAAESISHTVRYFPVSPLGHSPRPFIDPEDNEERIGPVPGKVNPLYSEIPVLWSLAHLHPEIFENAQEPLSNL